MPHIVLALTSTIQDAYDGGNESSKIVSIIIFGRFIKTYNHYFPLRRAFLLLLYWVFTFYLYAPSKRAYCHSEYNVHSPKIYYWLIHDYCRGDDFRGMPRAALSVGWRPRNLHGTKSRGPALAKGLAVPAAGWRLHRGELEPVKDDKTPPTAVSPKVAWPRQDRQRWGPGMMQATPGLNQSASKSLPHERMQGKREGICLQDAGLKGKATL
jgi:hypothetical protein